MSVLTCSFTVRSVCFRTSPANVSVHFSLEMHLEHSYHCVVFLSVHSSNSTLVLFCLVTLSKPSFSSITTALPGSSLFAPTRARAKTTGTGFLKCWSLFYELSQNSVPVCFLIGQSRKNGPKSSS